MSDQLAIFGGPKTITQRFPTYRSYGAEEVQAAKSVVESGVISKFLGEWDPDFFGGPKVQEFERNWERAFNVKHAAVVNSNTSGLMAALGAAGIEPGDEVIVSPWTMSATATAILVWNAIPVFADIEPETFNLDPVSIKKNITPRTKAIVVTDIFGHAADLDQIMDLAKRHGLIVIEDAAQAPGAKYHDRFVGTVADIGVYSLNYHKHIHTGEGGVCVTNNTELFERMQLIRNHAEAVVGPKGVTRLDNMIGFNFRLGEIEAAMGIEQLKKLPNLALQRNKMGDRLTQELKSLKGLKTPTVRSGCSHVYYIYGLTIDPSLIRAPRDRIVEALQAEGIEHVYEGYTILYRMPMYQKRIAYGKSGFPWTSEIYKGEVSYQNGICPNAERLNDLTLINLYTCAHHYTDSETDLVIKAFKKVWGHLDELK